ncbi:MAG TPA: hypothetical protein VF240_14435 [Pyrinomonadaceae bacterium]
MSVRDDTPEEGAPERPAGNDAAAAPRPAPERAPLGYYYDDGTNYETYDPRAEEERESQDGETGAKL